MVQMQSKICLNQKHTVCTNIFLSFQSRKSTLLARYVTPDPQKSICNECSLELCCADLVFTLSFLCRYAHPGHPAAGHAAHAGQRAAALLLCLLHFWHRRCSIMGRPPPKPLFRGRHLPFVSARCFLLV